PCGPLMPAPEATRAGEGAPDSGRGRAARRPRAPGLALLLAEFLADALDVLVDAALLGVLVDHRPEALRQLRLVELGELEAMLLFEHLAGGEFRLEAGVRPEPDARLAGGILEHLLVLLGQLLEELLAHFPDGRLVEVARHHATVLDLVELHSDHARVFLLVALDRKSTRL